MSSKTRIDGLRFNAEAYVTNIGYWLSADAERVDDRAVQTLCRYAFDELNVELIRAATISRGGFQNDSVYSRGECRCEKIADRYLDHYMYSLIRTDDVDWL